jgi:pantothenate synthetase
MQPGSRNARLSTESREKALSISRGLVWAERAVLEGAVSQPEQVAAHVRGLIEEAGGSVDYVEVRHLHGISTGKLRRGQGRARRPGRCRAGRSDCSG